MRGEEITPVNVHYSSHTARNVAVELLEILSIFFFFFNSHLATLVRSIKTNEYSNLGSTPSLIFFFMLSKHAFEDLVQFPGNI